MIIPFIQPIEQGSARREAVQGEGERRLFYGLIG